MMLVLALIVGGSVSGFAVAAQPGLQNPQPAEPVARRRIRHPVQYAYRPEVQPSYYDRPNSYRPYPYALPLPFFLGFAYQAW